MNLKETKDAPEVPVILFGRNEGLRKSIRGLSSKNSFQKSENKAS